jgi:ferrochelatase
MTRTAVIAFNLGGPDSLEAVEPFLFNLFNDPAIIGAPGPVRWLLAKFISKRRAPLAQDIYREIGGRSPLLPETEAQADALTAALADLGDVRVFACMRYWHPMSDAVAAQVAGFAPDRIVLLPLYPQFSTTTSGSSLQDWQRAAAAAGLRVPTWTVGCYPCADGLIEAQAALIAPALKAAATSGTPRLLMSAHGLPKKVIAAGDPYQWQVERTCAAVAAKLAGQGFDDLDWQVCYQSRVGPLEWIGPSTEAEIERAGGEGRPLVVAPVAFVSEHSETLVELDIEYRHLAECAGVPAYHRVPALGVSSGFINALARLVRDSLDDTSGVVRADGGRRICPASFGRCICAEA